MPKCNKWLPSTAPPVPPPNGLKELFERHMKAQGIGTTKLAKMLNVAPCTVSNRLTRSTEAKGGGWSYREIQQWAVALGISADELGEAILYGTRVKTK